MNKADIPSLEALGHFMVKSHLIVWVGDPMSGSRGMPGKYDQLFVQSRSHSFVRQGAETN